MKRLIAAAALLAAAFFGYRYYDASYAPERKYKEFAEEMLKRHYDSAAAMTDGLTAQDLARARRSDRVVQPARRRIGGEAGDVRDIESDGHPSPDA
jgi:hypothetical protein